MSIIKDSVQNELDYFFGRIERSDTDIKKVTNSAFTQARAKLKHTAFVELDKETVSYFYQNTSYLKWNGHRLVAIDGSSIVLPYTDEIEKKFGKHYEKSGGAAVILARISEAFDPLNHISPDVQIQPYAVSEHKMLIDHLAGLQHGDLSILDRNYPAFWVYKLYDSKNLDFCMRVQISGRGKVITDFFNSGEKEKITTIRCTTQESKRKCKELDLVTEDIKCRLIRIELDNGGTEILITSLLDCQKYPYGQFKELYHLRWPVEECYKLLKYRLEIENFSGKSIDAIYQDLFAKIFTSNLTSVLAYDTGKEIKEKTIHRKTKYKVNWSNAISKMKNSGFLLFIRDDITEILESLKVLFAINPVPIRPERSFPRPKHKHKRQFSICYK